jgi:hypothetical protein
MYYPSLKIGTFCHNLGCFVIGKDRPWDASSKGRIVHGTLRPRDGSSMGRIVTKNGDVMSQGRIILVPNNTDQVGSLSIVEGFCKINKKILHIYIYIQKITKISLMYLVGLLHRHIKSREIIYLST